MSDHPRPRRPATLSPQQAEAVVGDEDPALRSEIAHETARLLLGEGRARSDDPEVVDRLVRLVETEGLGVLVGLWSRSPAATLPGALWRLYVVGEWVRRDPADVARRYDQGIDHAEVAGAVAGVERPPGPDEVRRMTGEVLSGMFTGDFADQLERTAAFLRVLATGAAVDADEADEAHDPLAAAAMTRRGGGLIATADDLRRAARLWRAGTLE